MLLRIKRRSRNPRSLIACIRSHPTTRWSIWMSSWTSRRRMTWSENSWSRRRKALKMILLKNLMKLSWTALLPSRRFKKFHKRIRRNLRSTLAILTEIPKSKPLLSSKSSNFQLSLKVPKTRLQAPAKLASLANSRRRTVSKLKSMTHCLIQQKTVTLSTSKPSAQPLNQSQMV